MEFTKTLIHKFRNLESLLFKNHSCLCCGIEVPDENALALCRECLDGLEEIGGRVCVRCGERLSGDVLVCDACKDNSFAFDRNFSCYYYTGTASTLVKKFKYSSKKYYATTLARLMAQNEEAFDGVDIITFVPISKRRNRERGFNQAEELAKSLSVSKKMRCESLLIKDETKTHQAELGRRDRLTNLTGTIHFEKDKAGLIKGKTILIVDDVFTTGTTLSVCAAEIKKHHPKQVKTLTFAKTKLDSSK